jgi:hypothetical protein
MEIMKGILLAVIIAVVGWAVHSVAPWYGLALLSLAIAWAVGLKPVPSLIWAAIGGGVLWGLSAAWMNHLNEGILSARVGELMGGLSGSMLVVVTALLGALLAGLGGWLGGLLREG